MPMTINYERTNKSRFDYPACFDSKPDLTGINVLTCDLGNPQQRNEVIKFSIITQPALSNQMASSNFIFKASVNSTNPEKAYNRDDNTVITDIRIKVESKLVLSGNSQPALIVYNSSSTLPSSSSNADELVQRGLLSERDLGEEVFHNYQLQNKGPSTINDISLTILWTTKTKSGDYLLYLVDAPLTSKNVRCKQTQEMPINPLGLKYERGNSNQQQVGQQWQRSDKTASGADSTGYFFGSWGDSSRRTLNKRQAQLDDPQATIAEEQALGPASSTVDAAILQQHLSCGPTQCNRFECNVIDLAHDEIATIQIRSRLYSETLKKISMREFDISSKLVAQIKALPYNVSTASMPPYIYEVKTQVRTIGLAVQDLLPWWLIALAVLLGLLLFILLACFLKYLGFFARKRPPKSAEREPLTPTVWNDYQYTPGDTAL